MPPAGEGTPQKIIFPEVSWLELMLNLASLNATQITNIKHKSQPNL